MLFRSQQCDKYCGVSQNFINCWLTAGGWEPLGLASGTDLRGSCFRYKVSLCDGRRGTFSFYRKIYKSAPMLISGWFGKGFTFMLLTLHDGTTAQLQICSSERNVPLLPVDWKTISKRMMPANPVCVTNIKAPEPAVKGTPQKQLRIP